jgi:hypothetical protein
VRLKKRIAAGLPHDIGGNGSPLGIRTPDLCRVNLARIDFRTTYKTAGTAKVRGNRTRHRMLWVGLWVDALREAVAFGACANPSKFFIHTAPVGRMFHLSDLADISSFPVCCHRRRDNARPHSARISKTRPSECHSFPRGRPHREVSFRCRCSLSFMISLKSATGRISFVPNFMPGCCEIS